MMPEISVNQYLNLIDLFNELQVSTVVVNKENGLRLNSLAKELDKIWHALSETEKEQITLRLQVSD
jgi:hypothetical protein